MYRIFIFVTCLFFLPEIKSQQRFVVEVSEHSEVNILGSSNVVPFRLKQKLISFTGKQQTVHLKQSGRYYILNENVINIPVNDFYSENKMALRDFKKLMLSQKYPNIVLILKQFSVPEYAVNNERFHLNIPIDITITNQSKPYIISVNAVSTNEKLIVKASKRINIRDFGLEPPVTMMGLIRVSEWIEIQISAELILHKTGAKIQ